MSVEDVGEISDSLANFVQWTIPSFSLISQKKDIRIWSPLFIYCENIGKCVFVFWSHIGFLGLKVDSKDGNDTPVKCVRFGIADIQNREISCCYGEWVEIERCFRVPKLASTETLNCYCRTSNATSRFRFFCEILNNQFCQRINASTETNNVYAMASTMSSVSTSKTEGNWSCGNCTFSNSINKVSCEVCGIPNSAKLVYPAMASTISSDSTQSKEGNWSCGYCTFSNSIYIEYCEICGIPKSAKDKYPDNSQTVASVSRNLGSSVTNLPLCITCFENERDIVFQPCCHLITCRVCANLLSNCPTCRKPITNKLKVFIN